MVRITNGVKEISVPEGAVKVYKNMGFRIVGEKNISHNKQNNVKGEDINKNKEQDKTIFLEGLLEKPISQWNQEEVKEFAAAKGYDVSNAKSLKEARNIIKKALEEEEKATIEA